MTGYLGLGSNEGDRLANLSAALAAQERSYHTLERLCAAVADRLMDRFGAEAVRVKAAKPEPPIPLPVDEVSVEVWKEA